jgi:hypothetical protein
MAGIKISDMTPDDSITGVEIVPVSDALNPKSVTISGIKNFTVDQIEAITAAVATTGSDSIFILQGGEMKPVDIDLVSAYALGVMWGKALETAPDALDTMTLNDEGTEKTITLPVLAEYVRATIEASILDISSLTPITSTAPTDVMLVTQGTAAKQITIANITTSIYSALKDYVTALGAVTAAVDSDVFYVIQGGVEKKVTLDKVKAYLGNPVSAPGSTTIGNIPQWSSITGALADGIGVTATVGSPGSTSRLVAEAGIRKAMSDLTFDQPALAGNVVDATTIIVDDGGASASQSKTTFTKVLAWILTKLAVYKIDDFAEGDDNTDLDSSTLRHGLMPKLSGSASQFLNGIGVWVSQTVTAAAVAFDAAACSLVSTNVQDAICESLFAPVNVSASVSPAVAFKSYFVDTSGGAINIALPNVDATTDGQQFRIYMSVNTNSVTVTTVGGIQSIGDSTSQLISQVDTGITVIANNTNGKYEIIQDSRGAALESSSITYFALTEASGVSTYLRVSTSTDDPDFSSTATNLATGAISGADQEVVGFSSAAGTILGFLSDVNATGIANIRRTASSNSAYVQTRVYHRTAGGTETLIGESSNSDLIDSATYSQFTTSTLINSGATEFTPTDLFIIKLFFTKVGIGTDPEFEMQVEGSSPARYVVAVPSSSIAHDALAGVNDAAAGVAHGHITAGAQTIAGVKTFSSSPIVPAPTTDLQAATKKYVDDSGGGGNTVQSISYAATIAPNITTGNIIEVGDLTGDITLNNFTNGTAGDFVEIWFTQDATGGRTITTGTNYIIVGTNASYPTDPLAKAVLSGTLLDDGGTLKLYGGWFPVSGDEVFGNLKINGQAWSELNTLTAGATIATNCDNGNVHEVTMTVNATLSNPTNPEQGATYIWIVEQGGVGSFTLAYGTNFAWPGGAAPTLSTAVGSIDILTGVYRGTKFLMSSQLDFS